MPTTFNRGEFVSPVLSNELVVEAELIDAVGPAGFVTTPEGSFELVFLIPLELLEPVKSVLDDSEELDPVFYL